MYIHQLVAAEVQVAQGLEVGDARVESGELVVAQVEPFQVDQQPQLVGQFGQPVTTQAEGGGVGAQGFGDGAAGALDGVGHGGAPGWVSIFIA
jgi:hypothetical protein